MGLTSVVASCGRRLLEYVPVARVTNLVRLIEQLKERNIWVVGAAAEAKQLYTDWDWKPPPRFFSAAKDTVCTGWFENTATPWYVYQSPEGWNH